VLRTPAALALLVVVFAAGTFVSTAGALLTALGTQLLLDEAALAVAWSVIALDAAGLGFRFDRATLRLHAALYLWGAAAASALLASAATAFLAGNGRGLAVPTTAGWLTAAAVVAGYAFLGRKPAAETRPVDRLPQVLVAVLLAGSVGGIVVAAVAAALPAPGAAEVATLRTAVLAVLAVVLAAAARRFALPEVRWLVYPLVALGGLKLVLEDLGEGRPSTLFLSLVLYGGALIVAPRLLRRPA